MDLSATVTQRKSEITRYEAEFGERDEHRVPTLETTGWYDFSHEGADEETQLLIRGLVRTAYGQQRVFTPTGEYAEFVAEAIPLFAAEDRLHAPYAVGDVGIGGCRSIDFNAPSVVFIRYAQEVIAERLGASQLSEAQRKQKRERLRKDYEGEKLLRSRLSRVHGGDVWGAGYWMTLFTDGRIGYRAADIDEHGIPAEPTFDQFREAVFETLGGPALTFEELSRLEHGRA